MTAKVVNIPHEIPTEELRLAIEDDNTCIAENGIHIDGWHGYNVVVDVPERHVSALRSRVTNFVRMWRAAHPAAHVPAKNVEVVVLTDYAPPQQAQVQNRRASYLAMVHVVNRGGTSGGHGSSSRADWKRSPEAKATRDFIAHTLQHPVEGWAEEKAAAAPVQKGGRKGKRKVVAKDFSVEIAYVQLQSPRDASAAVDRRPFDATPVPGFPNLILFCVQKHKKKWMYPVHRDCDSSDSCTQSDSQSTSGWQELSDDCPQFSLQGNVDNYGMRYASDQDPPRSPDAQAWYPEVYSHNPYPPVTYYPFNQPPTTQ
eukprot:Rhum_TRINITY_DN2593_c0_g1::Rhum_TRINITY_DN2593_c0_g1_i1::g.7337::m.7337